MTERLLEQARDIELDGLLEFYLWSERLKLKRIAENEWRLVGGRGVVFGPGSGMGTGRFIPAPTFGPAELMADDMRTTEEGPKVRSW